MGRARATILNARRTLRVCCRPGARQGGRSITCATIPRFPIAVSPGQPGNDFKPEVGPHSGETVIAKRTNSAFIGTDLEKRLRDAGHTTLVVTGVITNNSVEATVRMAGNLGFDTYVVSDATATVDKVASDGRRWAAEEVHALALANMDGEYARVVDTAAMLAMLEP